FMQYGGRSGHTATLLPNGKVLVAGGCPSGHTTATAELYDPATGSWSPTGSMITPRCGHTATVILGSFVLVAGGRSASCGYLRSAEIYNASDGRWLAAPDMLAARSLQSATAIASDKVLLVGGDDSFGNAARSAEVFSAWAWRWMPAGGPTTPRVFGHTTTRLGSGLVLTAGGRSQWTGPAVKSAEFYDPSSNSWSSAGTMKVDHDFHTATLLRDGSLLV